MLRASVSGKELLRHWRNIKPPVSQSSAPTLRASVSGKERLRHSRNTSRRVNSLLSPAPRDAKTTATNPPKS